MLMDRHRVQSYLYRASMLGLQCRRGSTTQHPLIGAVLLTLALHAASASQRQRSVLPAPTAVGLRREFSTPLRCRD